MKFFSLAILVLMIGLMADSVSAEVFTLNRPLWREIPGTKSDLSTQYSDPVNVNLNNVTRKGDIIYYELVNPDASYSRLETNCKTRQSRATRYGFFKSSSQVELIPIKDSWSTSEGSVRKVVTSYMCEKFK